jgi:hypothetical protein
MDNETNKSIDRITIEEWQAIFELIPTIEQTENFGEFIPPERISDNFSIYKGFESSRVVDEFVKRAYDNNIVVSFDWMQWEEGRKIIESETKDFSGLDKYTLCKLLIAHIRNDRFCDGWLISRFTDSTILNILKELRETIQTIN